MIPSASMIIVSAYNMKINLASIKTLSSSNMTRWNEDSKKNDNMDCKCDYIKKL